jgi:hypothetical protein
MSEMQLVVMVDALKRQLQELHAENARLRHERDLARANALAMLPQGTPEELAEMERLMATAVPLNMSGLIAELEAGRDQ